MQGLPQQFIARLSATLGQEKAQRVIAALSDEASVSVRYNPLKMTAVPAGSRPVGWNPYGYILPERPLFTLDPLFHAGAYYVQDSSAMIVGELFRLALEGYPLPDRPLRVLDLCAAPGGKTTDLSSSLRASGREFLLVANEVMRDRATVLRENVTLWGDPSVMVTSADPAAFSSLGGFFDIIVADVPCSGEGMFRKDPKAVGDWSEDNVRFCAARQKRIVSDVWPSLTEGGLLLYSTCTFSPEENDMNVAWIASELGAEIIRPSLHQDGPLQTENGVLMLPGFVPGEGQYAAVLRKKGTAREGRAVPRKASSTRPDASLQRFSTLLEGSFDIFGKEGRIFARPSSLSSAYGILQGLHPLLSGVFLGEMKGRDFVPSADLALSSALSGESFPQADLDKESALHFLHRDNLVLADAPRGYVIIRYEGVPLGFVKNLGTRCNNLHPSSRRIRMDINQS